MTRTPTESFQTPFKSFFLGGFECATHGRRDRTQIDVVEATHHAEQCAEDYGLLQQCGVLTVRDGLRWHLIEQVPGVYDWSSFLPMLHAAYAAGTQVIWDICHWGVPEHIDVFSDEFPTQFTRFAEAAARLIQQEDRAAGVVDPPVYCPINEISFWAWVGGDEEHFHPYGDGRGPELKAQLTRASIAAMAAIRLIEPRVRFLHAEPIIHVAPDDYDNEDDVERAEAHNEAQFEALDIIGGRVQPELGGEAANLDILGLNYYWNNQWIQHGTRTPPGHHLHRPLHVLLQDVWERYGRPILISETGAESDAAVGWLAAICAEVRQARRNGVPVLGICLYPVMDYPGWDDDRHCDVGLIALDGAYVRRSLREDLKDELQAQLTLLK